jgi:hypothetical protein
MKKRRYLVFFLVILVASLVLILISIRSENLISEKKAEWTEQDYYFDPSQYLSGTTQTDIFHEDSGEDTTIPTSIVPYHWNDQDFLKIISIFLLQKNIDINELGVNSITYKNNCSTVNDGYLGMSINFTEIELEKEYSLSVTPAFGHIEFSVKEINSSTSIENFGMKEIEIFADDALLIAEQKGGERIRTNNNNECFIWAKLGNDNNELVWDISYTTIDYPKSIFSIRINAQSGIIIK